MIRNSKQRARIAALEEKAGLDRNDELAGALRRAVDSLMHILPDIPEIWHRVQTAPAGYKVVVDVPGKNSCTCVQELSQRITKNEITEDDKRILDAFGRNAKVELHLLGKTATEFIQCWGCVLRGVEALY